jgi:hypothetical protein
MNISSTHEDGPRSLTDEFSCPVRLPNVPADVIITGFLANHIRNHNRKPPAGCSEERSHKVLGQRDGTSTKQDEEIINPSWYLL